MVDKNMEEEKIMIKIILWIFYLLCPFWIYVVIEEYRLIGYWRWVELFCLELVTLITIWGIKIYQKETGKKYGGGERSNL